MSNTLIEPSVKLDDIDFWVDADGLLTLKCEEVESDGESYFQATRFPELYEIFEKSIIPNPEKKGEDYQEFLWCLRELIESLMVLEKEHLCYFRLDKEGRERNFWETSKSCWVRYKNAREREWHIRIFYTLKVNVFPAPEEEDMRIAFDSYDKGALEERYRRERLRKE